MLLILCTSIHLYLVSKQLVNSILPDKGINEAIISLNINKFKIHFNKRCVQRHQHCNKFYFIFLGSFCLIKSSREIIVYCNGSVNVVLIVSISMLLSTPLNYIFLFSHWSDSLLLNQWGVHYQLRNNVCQIKIWRSYRTFTQINFD